ncbi:LysR family transcriptional regulator [Shimia sp. R10_1]|uniref:LysR family transcriptional regulator n=1 Tax=Shimia sp. R10_1 TaxID=2821095 RepID=UPI001ADA53B9|nr:LysR family transcriptional regulator [Shimia sp. R10_1]MBO9472508.1 LysR family transcriptional regulator [Shimia sp. R10_1]
MRLPLATLEVFTAIAEHGSLRAAADALGIKPSTVSHQLKTLEAQLGTALFIRTTRSVSLTEAGRALMRGAGPAFEQLSAAVDSARSSGHAARGTLKLALSESAYHMVVAPKIAAFSRAYPEIEVEFLMTDAYSDILGEGLHAGFRLGDRIAPDMVAVRLTPRQPLAVFGSPAYFAAHGRPETPRDLLAHSCIRYRFPSSGRMALWEFTSEEGLYSVDVTGPLISNALPASVDLARQGVGLTYTFRDYCTQDVAAGALEAVLDADMPETAGLFLYFPQEYRSMMPLRLFIDHLRGADGRLARTQ